MRPVSQPAPTVHHTVAPTAKQTRSHGPMEITSLFNQPSPPDAIQRKPATIAAQRNDKCPRSSSCSIRHHWLENSFEKFRKDNGTGTNQPIEGGEGPPQPPDGVGGGTGSLLSERGRRLPQQPAGGGGAPPPGGNGGGNGNGNGGGGRPPPPRKNGGNGSDGDDDGDDSLPPSDHGQPQHHWG